MLTAEELDYLKRVAPLPGRGMPILLGSQSARVVGSGGDFFQLRAYTPGDDLRKVAWRLSTRTGKLLLREPKHEGPMTWRRWLDQTPSMLLSERQPTVRKVIAALDWVWSRHRDRWADTQTWAWGETPLVLVTDLLWDEQQWSAFRITRRRQPLKIIHVSLQDEAKWLNPPAYAQDCETGNKIRIDANVAAIHSAQQQYWQMVQRELHGMPTARLVVGQSDLTALEGVIWS